MATPPSSGLDPSNLNFYGAKDEDTAEYQDSLKQSLKALEARYANPNWFNVAAGFFKPQLGGFSASLGSASEALGSFQEKQRESQLPIAELRQRLALSKIGMGQNKAAADKMQTWVNSGKPMTEAFLADITATAPNSPAAQAAKTALETERANQGLITSRQQLSAAQATQMLSQAQQEYASGLITRDAYQQKLSALRALQPDAPKPAATPADTSNTTRMPVAGAEVTVESSAAQPRVNIPGTVTPTAKGQLEIYAQEYPKVWKRAQSGDESAMGDLVALTHEIQRAGGSVTGASAVAAGVTPPAAKTPKAEKEVIPSVFGPTSELTPDQITALVKPTEELAQKRFAGMQEIAAPEKYASLERAVTSQISLIKNNKDAAQRVSAVLAGSPLLTALNEGVGVSLNGLSAQIRLPVEAFIRANLKPEDRDLAMAMANNYAAIAVAKQRMGGVSPNSARNSELGLYAALTPDLNTTPNASLRSLAHFKEDLALTKAQHDYANELLFNKHPNYQLSPTDPARYSSALNNPYFNKISEPYMLRHKAIDEAFEKSLKSKTKP